jgi:hypothetical protein
MSPAAVGKNDLLVKAHFGGSARCIGYGVDDSKVAGSISLRLWPWASHVIFDGTQGPNLAMDFVKELDWLDGIETWKFTLVRNLDSTKANLKSNAVVVTRELSLRCCANIMRVLCECYADVAQMRRASYARHSGSKCDVKRASCARHSGSKCDVKRVSCAQHSSS